MVRGGARAWCVCAWVCVVERERERIGERVRGRWGDQKDVVGMHA